MQFDRSNPEHRRKRKVTTPGTVAEENRAVVMRYVEEVWNRHEFDAIDSLVSPDYVNHAATTDEYRQGGARHIWEWILSVFPDHRFDVEHIAADGDTVAVLGMMVGTHEGDLMGLAPTGRRAGGGPAVTLVPGGGGQADRALGGEGRPRHDATIRGSILLNRSLFQLWSPTTLRAHA
jgi:predicted ester cyclase